jgi:hypothetical protein
MSRRTRSPRRRKPELKALAALLAGLSAGDVACGGASTADAPQDVTAGGVQRRVDGGGGKVVTGAGNGVEIPAGALAAGTQISVAEEPGAPAPVISGTGVSTPVTFGPEGQTFAVPVDVVLAVDVARLPSGKTLDDVVVLTAPRGSTAFEPLPTRARGGNFVLAQTTHFSTFVAFVPEREIGSGGAGGAGGGSPDGTSGGGGSPGVDPGTGGGPPGTGGGSPGSGGSAGNGGADPGSGGGSPGTGGGSPGTGGGSPGTGGSPGAGGADPGGGGGSPGAGGGSPGGGGAAGAGGSSGEAFVGETLRAEVAWQASEELSLAAGYLFYWQSEQDEIGTPYYTLRGEKTLSDEPSRVYATSAERGSSNVVADAAGRAYWAEPDPQNGVGKLVRKPADDPAAPAEPLNVTVDYRAYFKAYDDSLFFMRGRRIATYSVTTNGSASYGVDVYDRDFVKTAAGLFWFEFGDKKIELYSHAASTQATGISYPTSNSTFRSFGVYGSKVYFLQDFNGGRIVSRDLTDPAGPFQVVFTSDPAAGRGMMPDPRETLFDGGYVYFKAEDDHGGPARLARVDLTTGAFTAFSAFARAAYVHSVDATYVNFVEARQNGGLRVARVRKP